MVYLFSFVPSAAPDAIARGLFVVEEGKLTENGTHAELLALEDGTYRRLHGLQMELSRTQPEAL